ncbi:unnamed protein product [Effrenium voratum]|uniref:Uncharacterized protein n=1 Tax=Effrenium voratum TaxID=2562239 RepID=A0AA36IJN3_9DINO|nr:unnamed protein product [Effrenium voratum]
MTFWGREVLADVVRRDTDPAAALLQAGTNRARSQILQFERRFASVLSLWFVTLPGVAALASVLAPWVRFRVVFAVSGLAHFCASGILVYIYHPSVAPDLFEMKAKHREAASNEELKGFLEVAGLRDQYGKVFNNPGEISPDDFKDMLQRMNVYQVPKHTFHDCDDGPLSIVDLPLYDMSLNGVAKCVVDVVMDVDGPVPKAQMREVQPMMYGKAHMVDWKNNVKYMKKYVHYIFEHMRGFQCRNHVLRSQEEGKPENDKTEDEWNSGFDFIEEFGPRDNVKNRQLRWITIQTSTDSSPIYKWPSMLVEKCLRNLSSDGVLAAVHEKWPLTLYDIDGRLLSEASYVTHTDFMKMLDSAWYPKENSDANIMAVLKRKPLNDKVDFLVEESRLIYDYYRKGGTDLTDDFDKKVEWETKWIKAAMAGKKGKDLPVRCFVRYTSPFQEANAERARREHQAEENMYSASKTNLDLAESVGAGADPVHRQARLRQATSSSANPPFPHCW